MDRFKKIRKKVKQNKICKFVKLKLNTVEVLITVFTSEIGNWLKLSLNILGKTVLSNMGDANVWL